MRHQPSEAEVKLIDDHWKVFRELCGASKYLLTDTRDSVQVYSSLKVDLSSKVQLSEDLRRAIAASKVRPVRP